jgi:hypothetical protein
MSFEDLPLECQRNVLDRLHWRDVLAVSLCSRALRAVAEDEDAWRARCETRFSRDEMLVEMPALASTSSSSAESPPLTSFKRAFVRAVRRARDGARSARPLLDVPDNERVHFKRFEEAQRHLEGASLRCVGEFIFAADTRAPTLLVLAGMVECLARAPVATPDQTLEVMRGCGCDPAARKVRLQRWVLGRLDPTAPFRLRNDTLVDEGTLEELATFASKSRVWEALLRGMVHEVRDMEVESVGPRRKSFWSAFGVEPSPDPGMDDVFAPTHF